MTSKELSQILNTMAKEQGAKFAAAALRVTNNDIFIGDADSNTLSRKFASTLADSLNFYLKRPTEAETICRKLAATTDENWTNVEETMANTIYNEFIKTAAHIKKAGPLLPLMILSKNIPMAIAASVPIAAGGLGMAGHFLDKEMNEDDIKAERIKAKIRRYKIQTARLNKSMLAKHKDNSDSEEHEEEGK